MSVALSPWDNAHPGGDRRVAIRVLHRAKRAVQRRAPLGATAMSRIIYVLAGLSAILVAVAPPALTFLSGRDRVIGALEARATLYAGEVAEMARQSPALWEFDNVHVAASAGAFGAQERRQVFNAAGKAVLTAEPDVALAAPVLSQQAPVIIDGKLMGDARVTRSLRGVLAATAVSALFSVTLGTLLFLLLSLAPLRMLGEAMARVNFLATHDMLTQLPNRSLFGDRLQQALLVSKRDKTPLALLCLDLDKFKDVNDTLGHAAGDLLLKQVSARLLESLRESDTLARLGGDEFAIIMPRATQPDAAESLAKRLTERLAQPFDLNGHSATVGVSIGIALHDPAAPADPETLMHEGDLALYQAKGKGRGTYCFFAPEMNRLLQERQALEADLRVALAQGGFYLVFQPQVTLDTGAVTGAEALLRWRRPDGSEVMPGDFIALAEETGLIVPIGAWVLQEACQAATTWPEEMTLAVNVSPMQFRQAGLYESVVGALKNSGLRPERLELEITEGVVLSDGEDVLAVLARLRTLGVKLVMDDFGTGYSSLSYLQRFPFDKVKIDRSFIQYLGQDNSMDAIVRAVIGMSEALGLQTLAEGVETSEQMDILTSRGCQEGQGYLWGKPMSPAALDTLFVQETVTPRQNATRSLMEAAASFGAG